MNYFAHAWHHLDRPYFVAGTALPDWLNVVKRRVRIRAAEAQQLANAEPGPLTELAAGVLRHYHDDAWFHQHRTFAMLSGQATYRLRQILPGDDSFRPWFLGHIVVELLLDWALAEEAPQRLDHYYAQLDTIEPQWLVEAVERMTGQRLASLADWWAHFCRERFLYDYAEDGKLLRRINQVLRRVGLSPLDGAVEDWLSDCRAMVREHYRYLLVPQGA